MHSFKLFSQEEGCDEDASMCLKKVFKTCGKARQPPAKQHTITLNPCAPHVGTKTLRGSVVCQAEMTGPLVGQLVDQQKSQ